MKTRTGQAPHKSQRTGFTLIELLVVITIIAVLAALSTAAYQKVRVAAKRAAATSDINNMNVACTKFKLDFGFNPPQYIRFPKTAPPNTMGATAVINSEMDAGFAILQSMFRAYSAPTAAIPFGPVADLRGQSLSGSQCILFFLGGPQLQGFDSTGPYTPAGTAKKGPYMDFSIDRISPANEYLDTWGTPYAFFSSGRSDKYDINLKYTLKDSKGNNFDFRPFQDASKKWVLPGGVQIISAGPNQFFGPGSQYTAGPPALIVPWTPEAAPYGPGDDGEDDIANFNGGLQLGSSSK